MASLSLCRPLAKYVLGTKNSPFVPKTLGECLLIPLSSYHDNYYQHRPDCASLGKEETRYLPVKASSQHCYLLKGLCQNWPFPTPLFCPHPPPSRPLRPGPPTPLLLDEFGEPTSEASVWVEARSAKKNPLFSSVPTLSHNHLHKLSISPAWNRLLSAVFIFLRLLKVL